MGLSRIALELLDPADWNYRDEDPFMGSRLEANLARNGQVENLIVRQVGERWEVCNGNHRLEALRKIGAGEAICWDLGPVSREEAMRVSIETNETRFRPDQLRLAGVIRDVQAEFSEEDLAATMPYSPEEIREYAGLFDFSFSFDRDDDDGQTSISLDRDTFRALVSRARRKGFKTASEALANLLEEGA